MWLRSPTAMTHHTHSPCVPLQYEERESKSTLMQLNTYIVVVIVWCHPCSSRTNFRRHGLSHGWRKCVPCRRASAHHREQRQRLHDSAHSQVCKKGDTSSTHPIRSSTTANSSRVLYDFPLEHDLTLNLAIVDLFIQSFATTPYRSRFVTALAVAPTAWAPRIRLVRTPPSPRRHLHPRH